MFTSLYELEKCNKTNYDSVREYCLVEKVNEEYLRAAIRKNKGVEDKPTKKIKTTSKFWKLAIFLVRYLWKSVKILWLKVLTNTFR